MTAKGRHYTPALAAREDRNTQCLPDTMRLETIRAQESGRIRIHGVDHTESAIFEFVNWLKQIPNVESVSILSTNPHQAFGVAEVGFELQIQTVQVEPESVHIEEQDADYEPAPQNS